MNMKKLFCIFLSLSVICLFGIPSVQADKGIGDSIKKTLEGYQTAWNNKDTQKVVSYYHNEATIMTGRDKKMVTKKEYEKTVPKRFKHGEIKFHEPEVTVKGNTAEVKVKASFKKFDVKYKFLMVQDGDHWLIRVQKY